MAISKEDFTELVNVLENIEEELEYLNKLFLEIVRFPDDMRNPPRLMIEVRGPIEVE